MLEQEQKDYLTGFYLRNSLNNVLCKLAFDAEVNKTGFSVALIDLDHFKKYNDKHGHIFGDEILKYIASIVRLTLYKDACFMFRYGGDEFLLVFPEKDPKETFYLLRQCIYNMTQRAFLLKNKFYKITFSCGIAGFPSDGKTIEELIQEADKAMYFSKYYGRNFVTLAGKIKYLKIRNSFLLVISVCIILLSILVLYQLFFKKVVRININQLKNIKIITDPGDLDVILLKNGRIFKGLILEEIGDKIVLTLPLKKGKGTCIFNKSEIAEIKYHSKSKKKNLNIPQSK